MATKERLTMTLQYMTQTTRVKVYETNMPEFIKQQKDNQGNQLQSDGEKTHVNAHNTC